MTLTSNVLGAEATAALRQAGAITGWRDELYPVTHAFAAPPAALIERAAAPYFGIKVMQTCIRRALLSVCCDEHYLYFRQTAA